MDSSLLFPGASVIYAGNSKNLVGLQDFDSIVRSGRAVMYPVYKGTYECAGGLSWTSYITHTDLWREIAIDCAKDFRRSLDYLETRPEINREKFAYCGSSMGAAEGPRLIALEPRFKTGLLLFGGAYEREWPAELDPFNYAPRTRVPILMVNGMYDIIFAFEGSQLPLFQMLGTPEKDKRHFVINAGHGPQNQECIREELNWLDRYLGPVRTR